MPNQVTYKDILARIEQDFGEKFYVEKEKAGYFMLLPNGTLGGPDCGHSCPHRFYTFDHPSGWAYTLIDDKWFRLSDGICGWRRKDSVDPKPEYPNAPKGFMPF